MSLLHKLQWKQPLQFLPARLLKQKLTQADTCTNLQPMLVNMPRRTIVMVKSRTCHQVTSRLTSSDLAKVINVFLHPTKV